MILGYHIVFGTYGFWLSNDPCGSWSDFVGSWEIFRYGRATKTDARISVAHVSHDYQKQLQAKSALKYSPVHFSESQIVAVAQGIDRAGREAEYTIYACSILADHVHLVIGRHDRDIRQIMPHFKARATHCLVEGHLWVENDRPVWGKGGWKIFLDRTDEMRRAIRYVEENPEKEGLGRQHWPFVTPYESDA